MSSTPTSVAPLDGVIRYPHGVLITFVRSTLKAKQEHHSALRKAADEKRDEDETEEQSNILQDIDRLVFNLDSARWKADLEEVNPQNVWNAGALRHFADSSASERALFGMEVGKHKVEWVSEGKKNRSIY